MIKFFKNSFLISFFSLVFFTIVFSSCRRENEEDFFKPIKPTDCDTTNITYTLHLKAIFDSHCVLCHSGSAVEGSDLDTYQNIMKYIENNSPPTLLYDYVKNNNHKGVVLNNCQLNQFEIWINNPQP